MATPTLPYPNMDFTPLDVLTAAEMDQMVANDQYLRNFCAGLANGTNIDNGVILPSKLVNSFTSYTTDEVDTGFKWTDGKAIYRKVINFGALPNNSSKTVTWAGTNTIDVITSLSGTACNSGRCHPLPYIPSYAVAGDYVYHIELIDNPKNTITIKTGTERSSLNGTVVVEYTKVS